MAAAARGTIAARRACRGTHTPREVRPDPQQPDHTGHGDQLILLDVQSFSCNLIGGRTSYREASEGEQRLTPRPPSAGENGTQESNACSGLIGPTRREGKTIHDTRPRQYSEVRAPCGRASGLALLQGQHCSLQAGGASPRPVDSWGAGLTQGRAEARGMAGEALPARTTPEFPPERSHRKAREHGGRQVGLRREVDVRPRADLQCL